MSKVRKAIIATAGYGTRFLPETKSISKEMINLIDKPIIQYIVEELVASGIKDIIMIVRGNNTNLGNHFDENFELENHLEKNKKFDKLEEIQKITQMANFVYIRQNQTLPYGNGTPLLCVKDLLEKGEYFAYIFADDLVMSQKPALLQLIEKFDEVNAPVIATQEIQKEEVNKYGIVELKDTITGEIKKLVEKPAIEEAPSTLASYGRYILSTAIIDILEEKQLGKDSELWIVDAINKYALKERVYNVTVDGEWLTTGDPLNYMKAMLKYALKREDLQKPLLEFMKGLYNE